MKKTLILILAVLSVCISVPSAARERNLHIVTTGDVHGSWFDQPYVDGGEVKTSLMSVKYYVDSLRKAVGRKNVVLLDAGDVLQGDNASFYFNYIHKGDHLYPRLARYMKYDALVMGNHDVETGHPVYDKVYKELKYNGIPWLAGNAIDNETGESVFPSSTVFTKGGVKVLVVGFNNANISAWLSEELWSGMHYISLTPLVQEVVDDAVAATNPDVVIAVVHSGTGEGDGEVLESQGLDIFKEIRGVDVLVCAHDHAPVTYSKDGCVLLNGGARGANVGHAVIKLDRKGRKVLRKSVTGEVVRMDRNKVDVKMRARFQKEFDVVKAFTNQRVGSLAVELRTRDAYKGMSDYVNLVHTVQISVPEAKLSFAAPLTFNGTVNAGDVIYNDMFTIYPFENQLFVLNLSGSEIKNYLEYSYDGWIQTPGEHLLKISKGSDARTGADRWSFDGRTYNFDSAAGLVYTVDVTKPMGSRVNIESFVDGSAFDLEAVYPVAMTSYRASGGGELLSKGAGLTQEEMDARVIARYPGIRELVYEFFKEHGDVDAATVGNTSVIGSWKFIPESVAEPLLEKDMALVF